jgi:hypothetical protein
MVIRLSKKVITLGIVLIFFLATFTVINLFAEAEETKGLKVQLFVTKPYDVSGEARIAAATNANYDLFENVHVPAGKSFQTVIQFPSGVIEKGIGLAFVSNYRHYGGVIAQ